jgi:hypothetical protein
VATSAVHRVAISFVVSILLFDQPLLAFQTPLSDTAVREAYFLGQRHDQSVSDFFAKYAKTLPAPQYGPYISTVRFLTPYAQVVSLSGNKSAGYSAQQAERDHHADAETVTVSVDIYFTDSYGPFLAAPTNSRSSSPAGLVQRSSDFWQDFDVAVIANSTILTPRDTSGQPIYNCSEHHCSLVGATITLTFAAGNFPSDSVTANVVPPEGDEVNVDFDLTSFR